MCQFCTGGGEESLEALHDRLVAEGKTDDEIHAALTANLEQRYQHMRRFLAQMIDSSASLLRRGHDPLDLFMSGLQSVYETYGDQPAAKAVLPPATSLVVAIIEAARLKAGYDDTFTAITTEEEVPTK